MKKYLLFMLLFMSNVAYADTPDYSGVYDCKGQDHSEGPYSGVVTLKRIAAQSSAQHAAYQLTFDVPGYGQYRGQTAATGDSMAFTFAFNEAASKDYGTGIAKFTALADGRWAFSKFYYQPEYKGGNYGHEECVQQ